MNNDEKLKNKKIAKKNQTFYISQNTFELIKQIAKNSSMSRNEVLEFIIEDFVKTRTVNETIEFLNRK